jgi:hypothetical protein
MTEKPQTDSNAPGEADPSADGDHTHNVDALDALASGTFAHPEQEQAADAPAANGGTAQPAAFGDLADTSADGGLAPMATPADTGQPSAHPVAGVPPTAGPAPAVRRPRRQINVAARRFAIPPMMVMALLMFGVALWLGLRVAGVVGNASRSSQGMAIIVIVASVLVGLMMLAGCYVFARDIQAARRQDKR